MKNTDKVTILRKSKIWSTIFWMIAILACVAYVGNYLYQAELQRNIAMCNYDYQKDHPNLRIVELKKGGYAAYNIETKSVATLLSGKYVAYQDSCTVKSKLKKVAQFATKLELKSGQFEDESKFNLEYKRGRNWKKDGYKFSAYIWFEGDLIYSDYQEDISEENLDKDWYFFKQKQMFKLKEIKNTLKEK